MDAKGKKREVKGPSHQALRRDKDVIVHQRSPRTPAPFVSQFSVRQGVNTLEIFRGSDKISEGRKRNEGT